MSVLGGMQSIKRLPSVSNGFELGRVATGSFRVAFRQFDRPVCRPLDVSGVCELRTEGINSTAAAFISAKRRLDVFRAHRNMSRGVLHRGLIYRYWASESRFQLGFVGCFFCTR